MNDSLELTPGDYANILALLSRVSYQGFDESLVGLQLKQKLEAKIKELKPVDPVETDT